MYSAGQGCRAFLRMDANGAWITEYLRAGVVWICVDLVASVAGASVGPGTAGISQGHAVAAAGDSFGAVSGQGRVFPHSTTKYRDLSSGAPARVGHCGASHRQNSEICRKTPGHGYPTQGALWGVFSFPQRCMLSGSFVSW